MTSEVLFAAELAAVAVAYGLLTVFFTAAFQS